MGQTEADPAGRSIAEAASTWMQVVFGGLSVTVAIAGLVIAYFAWIQPHSAGDDKPAAPVAAGTTNSTGAPAPTSRPATADARRAGLVDLTPDIGGDTVRRSGSDLTMACASGQSTDRQRTVQYDLAGRYLTLTATLLVEKAPDTDSQVQIKIFTDDRQAAAHTLTRGETQPLNTPLDRAGKLRIELRCQSANSALTIKDAVLSHA